MIFVIKDAFQKQIGLSRKPVLPIKKSLTEEWPSSRQDQAR